MFKSLMHSEILHCCKATEIDFWAELRLLTARKIKIEVPINK